MDEPIADADGTGGVGPYNIYGQVVEKTDKAGVIGAAVLMKENVLPAIML